MERFRSDDGVALISAVLVMTVVIALSLVIAGIAVASNRDSGRDRQRTSAIQVAEGQVDATFAALQSAGEALLPCSPTPDVLKTSPDSITTVLSIKYVVADPAVAPACPAPAGQVTGAVIDAVATANRLQGAARVSRRHMQAYVKLTPNYANGLTKAIFAGGAFTSDNQTTLHGNGASNADVYTNSDLVCSNNQTYDGAVYSQGSITMSNTCEARGDVWAKGNVTQSGNSSIGGKVWSSNGNVSVGNSTTVVGSLKAKGSVSWGNCNTSKCFPTTLTSPVNDPPYEPFPQLNSTSTVIAFRNAGFTNYVEITDCTTAGGATGWVQANAATLTGKTLLKTTCPLSFSGADLRLADDLAIFSTAGFSSSGQGFDSTTSALRKLYWIVPYDAATIPCTSPGITTSNQFSITANVDMLLYSPCDISFSNKNPHIGQIYSGSNLSIRNQFDLSYRPLDVYGVANSGGGAVSNYNVDIVYKREVG